MRLGGARSRPLGLRLTGRSAPGTRMGLFGEGPGAGALLESAGLAGVWPSGKAPDSGSGDRRFESFRPSQLRPWAKFFFWTTEQAFREQAQAFCDALTAGDIGQACRSDEPWRNHTREPSARLWPWCCRLPCRPGPDIASVDTTTTAILSHQFLLLCAGHPAWAPQVGSNGRMVAECGGIENRTIWGDLAVCP